MNPEWAELIRRAVVGAPAPTADQLAELRQLLPPTTPVTRTNTHSRQEVAA